MSKPKNASSANGTIIQFSQFRFCPHHNRLTSSQDIFLEYKQTQVLLLLLANAGKLVTKNELLNFVWADKVVGDDVLTVAISNLRKILGDSARQPQYIKTIPGDGYIFIGELKNAQQKIAQGFITNNLQTNPDTLPRSNTGVSRHWVLITSLIVIILLSVFYLLPVQYQQEPSASHVKKLISQAQILSDEGSNDGLREALRLYEQAAVLDETSAKAYFGQALTQYKILKGKSDLLYVAKDEILGLLDHAEKFDPENDAIYFLRANILFYVVWDSQTADAHYQKAILINPKNPVYYYTYAQLLMAINDFAGATKAIEQARALDPTLFATPTTVWIFNMQERYDEAMLRLEQLFTVRPGTLEYHKSAFKVLDNFGYEDKAFNQLIEIFRLKNYPSDNILHISKLFEKGGLEMVYHWLAFEKHEVMDVGHYSPPLSWARYAIRTKDYEQALSWIEEALSERQLPLLWMNIDPIYKPLRNSPRFKAIIEKLNLHAN